MQKCAILLLILIFTVSCNSEDPTKAPDKPTPGRDPYESQIAQGKMFSDQWVFITGTAKYSITSSDYFEIKLMNQDYDDPCDPFTMPDQTINAPVPARKGKHPAYNRNQINMITFNDLTYFDPYNNQRGRYCHSQNGYITITAITANEVHGIINTTCDADNSVSGYFMVELCK